MRNQVALLLAALVAVSAFSVTPNMAVNFGGSEDDRTLGLLPSASGMIYAVGETVSQAVNVSYTTGGPLGTTTNTAVTAFTGTNSDGFLTKLAPNGQPIWTAKLTGAGNESIAAVALSPAQDVVYICGRFSSTTASLQGTTLTNSQSDGTSDAFAAAINATNGLYIWHAIAYSSADDNCLAIAATATNVVFGGSFGNNNLGAGAAATLQMNGGTAAARTQGTVGWGGGYIARVNPADGLGQRLGDAPVTHDGGAANLGGEVRALTFDSSNYLWIGGVMRCDSNQPDYLFGFGADLAVVNVYHNLSIADGIAFERSGLIRFDGSYPAMSAGVIGSSSQNILTGLTVVSSALGNGATAANVRASRVFITGYTAGAAGTLVNFSSPDATATPYSSAIVAAAPSANAAWYGMMEGNLEGKAADVYARFLSTSAGLQTRFAALSFDAASSSAFVAGSIKGTGSVTVATTATPVGSTAGSWDAFMIRISSAGVVGWLQVSGGPFDDAGLASGVVVKSGVPNPTPRPFIFYGGAFANVSVDAPFSASPIRRNSFGKLDAFVVSFDDVDDCGLAATGPYPWGPNPCGVTQNPVGPGASVCLDQPNFPLCFCNMNYTSSAPGFCNVKGWDCSFMAPYYLGLLNNCNCPAAANPNPNPLLDIAPRLTACGGNVCSFGSLPAPYQNCLPLTLDLLTTCGASPATPASDRANIAVFNAIYGACPPPFTPGSSSSTGVREFGAAPRAASTSVATAVALLAAAVAVAFL